MTPDTSIASTSDFNSLKRALDNLTDGTVLTVTSSSSIQSFTISHNLGYVPQAAVFYTPSTQSSRLLEAFGSDETLGAGYTTDPLSGNMTAFYEVNSTNLIIKVGNASGGAGTVTVKYAIYVDATT